MVVSLVWVDGSVLWMLLGHLSDVWFGVIWGFVVVILREVGVLGWLVSLLFWFDVGWYNIVYSLEALTFEVSFVSIVGVGFVGFWVWL